MQWSRSRSSCSPRFIQYCWRWSTSFCGAGMKPGTKTGSEPCQYGPVSWLAAYCRHLAMSRATCSGVVAALCHPPRAAQLASPRTRRTMAKRRNRGEQRIGPGLGQNHQDRSYSLSGTVAFVSGCRQRSKQRSPYPRGLGKINCSRKLRIRPTSKKALGGP